MMTAKAARRSGLSDDIRARRRTVPSGSLVFRDLCADWKRWTLVDRIIAVAIVALYALIATGPFLVPH